MTKKLTEILTKEEAFNQLHNVIESHVCVDCVNPIKMMYEEIKTNYFNGNDLKMKKEFMTYQIQRYQKINK